MEFPEKFLQGITERCLEVMILLIHTHKYELGNRLHGDTNPTSSELFIQVPAMFIPIFSISNRSSGQLRGDGARNISLWRPCFYDVFLQERGEGERVIMASCSHWFPILNR